MGMLRPRLCCSGQRLLHQPWWEPSGLVSGYTMPVLQGQVSRDDVAALCVELLEQPAALNTTFEVCSSGPAGGQQDLKVHGFAT